MFGSCSGYSKQERLALTKALLTDALLANAQQLADTKQIPVILCGDWNCLVDEINLPFGAFQALPMSPGGDNNLDSSFEERGIDTIFFLNPIKIHLMPSKVQFFKWFGNVKAAKMGGLKTKDIDRLYCLGGKHRPIVANIIVFNGSKDTKQELHQVLLDVCSWNPKSDKELNAEDTKNASMEC